MISIEAWRRAIGGFTHPRAARVCAERVCGSYEDYSLSARLFCTAIMMWTVVFTHVVINNFMQTYASTNTDDVLTDCHIACVQTNGSFIGHGVTDICTLFQAFPKDIQKQFYFSTLLRSGIEPNPGPPYTLDELCDMFQDAKKEIEELKKEVADLRKMRTEYEAVKKESEKERQVLKEEIEGVYKYTDEIYTTHEDETNTLKRKVKDQERLIERQEIYSRRENVILKGVRESENENVLDSVVKIMNVDENDHKVEPSDFQRVHRLGKPMQGKTRPVIVRFVNFSKKLAVLKSKQAIKDRQNVKITNDLTSKQREILSVIHQNSPGVNAWFRGEQLMVNGVRRDPDEFRSGGTPAGQHGDGAWRGGRRHNNSDRGRGRGRGGAFPANRMNARGGASGGGR